MVRVPTLAVSSARVGLCGEMLMVPPEGAHWPRAAAATKQLASVRQVLAQGSQVSSVARGSAASAIPPSESYTANDPINKAT